MTTRGSNTHTGFLRAGFDRFVCGKPLTEVDNPETLGHREGEEGKEIPRWLSDLALQPSRKSLGQKAPKGSSSLGSL